jgi:multicomponent Na+:H+ antiporter subunit F
MMEMFYNLTGMITFYKLTGIILFAIMFLVFYRVIFGPTVTDRMVAVNMIGTKTTVLLIFIGAIFERTDMFIDFALTYALLNFIGTVAATKYFQRAKAVDLQDFAEEPS